MPFRSHQTKVPNKDVYALTIAELTAFFMSDISRRRSDHFRDWNVSPYIRTYQHGSSILHCRTSLRQALFRQLCFSDACRSRKNRNEPIGAFRVFQSYTPLFTARATAFTASSWPMTLWWRTLSSFLRRSVSLSASFWTGIFVHAETTSAISSSVTSGWEEDLWKRF